MTNLLVTRKKELKVSGHTVTLRRLVSKDKKACAVSLTINGYKFRSLEERYFQSDLKDFISSISTRAQRSHMIIFVDVETDVTYRVRLHEDGSISVASTYEQEANPEVLSVATIEQLHEVVQKSNLTI